MPSGKALSATRNAVHQCKHVSSSLRFHFTLPRSSLFIPSTSGTGVRTAKENHRTGPQPPFPLCPTRDGPNHPQGKRFHLYRKMAGTNMSHGPFPTPEH